MAQLPPKVPNMTQNWPDISNSHHHHHHQRLPSMDSLAMGSAAASQGPSWVDDFLDFSSSKRGSHRRSVSDSIAFLDQVPMPMVDQLDHEEECRRSSASGSRAGAAEFDRFDEEQFMAMFTDEVAPTVSCSNPSSPSDHNSMDEDHNKRAALPSSDQQMKQLRNESDEVESASDGQEAAGLATSMDNYNDKIFDPKRVKRILANRQSAQRSRVRKLQYISELERSVNSLQAEVSVLSPRVAFLDHQRLVLNVDNSVLKQRIAALAQDKVFKDAHQEALKREIERLRQMYNYQQNRKKMENGDTTAPQSPAPLPKSLLQMSADKISDRANCSAHQEQIMIS